MIVFEDASLTSQASPPPGRDHQHKDQQFPIILKVNKKIHNTNTINTNTITETPSPMTITAKDLNTSTADELAQLICTIAQLLDEDTVDYVHGTLSKDPYDDDTREFVCLCLMEALSSRGVDGVDESTLCDSLFALLDFNKQQQQQRDTTTSKYNSTNKQDSIENEKDTNITNRSTGTCCHLKQ